MSKNSRTTERGRSAVTGQFIPKDKAKRNPSTTVVERVPKSGYGDTSRPKKGR